MRGAWGVGLAMLLQGCAPEPPPAPPPPVDTPAPATPTPEPRGLTAAELLALDEEDSWGVTELADVEESVAPPAATPSPTPSSVDAGPARLPAARAPTPTPKPRPYRFTGWEEGARGFERVAREHDSRQKAVVLYFHTDWCGWCRKLERDYFAHPRFARWLRRMPRVHINPEDGEAEREIAAMLGVRGYPNFVVMPAGNTYGTRLHPFVRGGEDLSVDAFLEAAEAAAEPNPKVPD